EGGIPKEELPRGRKILARGALIVLGLTLVQAAFGAELRGQLEVIEQDHPAMQRGDWIHEANWVDQVHRSYSWVVMGAVLWLGYYAHKRMDHHQWLRIGTQIAGLLVLLQIAAGIGLAYVSLPPPLQVVHLITATLLIASITLIYLLATRLPVQDATSNREQEAIPVTNLHAVSKS
ncbi:MAG TPA: COX15/CtaA family protein, partial [Aggregatilineales bacterium]|nr:COX15/CtaA family protein [Aggregatilineales bacterium]